MKYCIVFLPVILFLAGCADFSSTADLKSSNSGEGFFIVAEWNAQALFDGKETGSEYGEYLEAAGWTAEKYKARITAVSQALLQMIRPESSPSGKAAVPDLIGLVELENAGILDDLARGSLSKHGYSWTAFANIPGAPLGLGFLSRFPLLEAKAHSITAGKDIAPRPVLEVRVEPEGKPLVFLLCHWKSKLGGDKETEILRRASARVVRRRLLELKEAEAETPVIVMGDLNENHDEFYRSSGAVLSALLPDDPDAAALTASGAIPGEYLVLSGEKPPRTLSFPKDTYTLFTPWETEMTGGSYFYRGEWETIDHFLLSARLFDSSGWDFAGCRVLDHAPFTASDGSPAAYVPRSGRGLSDHLPLLLYLKRY